MESRCSGLAQSTSTVWVSDEPLQVSCDSFLINSSHMGVRLTNFKHAFSLFKYYNNFYCPPDESLTSIKQPKNFWGIVHFHLHCLYSNAWLYYTSKHASALLHNPFIHVITSGRRLSPLKSSLVLQVFTAMALLLWSLPYLFSQESWFPLSLHSLKL